MSLLKVAGTTASSGQLYVNDVFSTYLYTGNGSTQTITNGIDLAGKGGLVWIKSRSQGSTNYIGNNLLYGSAIGYERMISNVDNAAGSGNVISVSSTGFTTEALAASSYNGDNFVSWTFRKAAKFFDVVTYTGTGSARTIAHNLGVAPGMVIVKRTDASANWQVYSNGLTSAANSIQLNLYDAQASAPTVWNSTAPTSSVFSVGTDSTVNASGGTYVAYLYAHDTSSTGIIQCGSFTTNGTVAGYDITLGWEPQYVLVKRTDDAGTWQILDTMRGFYRTGQNYLFANLSNAETDNSNDTTRYPTATGFHYGGTGSDSGTSFIYMAIRRPNKPPTTGTQVYNVFTSTSTETTSTPATSNITDDLFLNVARDGGYCVPFDRLRGAGIRLFTQSTDAEQVTSTGAAFDVQTGIRWLGSYSNVPVNKVNYHFKRAPGFFDEVCYTGTGANTTQAHNLTVVPELMIVKSRSSGVQSWYVYSAAIWGTGIGGTPGYDGLRLNSNVAAGQNNAALNSTQPTASVFSLGTLNSVNQSAETFVNYLFATLAGISKVGSYTGNGTGQVIACGFSAGARFVLIKRADSTGDWYTFDSARGLTVGSSPYLLLNSTAAEVTGNNGVYQSTGGFTLGATAITTTNILGASYIYLSVA